MVDWVHCPYVSSESCWKAHHCVILSCAVWRRIGNRYLHSIATRQQIHDQGHLTQSAEYWYLHLWRIRRRGCTAVRGTVTALESSGSRRDQEVSSAIVAKPCKEIKFLCEVGPLEEALYALDLMEQRGIVPSVEMYRSLLKRCTRMKALAAAKLVHAHLAKHKLECTGFLGESVVKTLVKCGGLEDAVEVFDGLPLRTVVSWTAVISGLVDSGQDREALKMYSWMLDDGVQPDSYTFISLLKACSNVADLGVGKCIHAEASKYGYVSNLFVGTSLVDMYAKCGSIRDAQHVFDGLLQRDAISWNAMLTGYLQQGLAESSLQLYLEMGDEGIEPTPRTLLSAIQACSSLAETAEVLGQPLCELLLKGKVIHAEAQRRGYLADVFVGNALVTMYAKCGRVVDAQTVFCSLSQRDVVSWNAMLAGYVSQGQEGKGLELYSQMALEDVSPDARTIIGGLQACGTFAQKQESVVMDGQLVRTEALQRGKSMHAEACTRGYELDMFVGCTLISTYGKCGSILDAENVFDKLSGQDNVVPWNAMLAAYAEQGQAELALQLYRRMEGESGLIPDEATLVCLLQACSNAGALDICVHVHRDLVSTRHNSSLLVANTLIHTYGNCASMVDGQKVFDGLSQPSIVSWNTLIAGYARQGNCDRSVQCFEDMQVAGVQPNGVTFLSLLSACSHAGLVDEGAQYFESMSREYGILPDTEHYISMVDLLGRAGHFEMVEALLSQMPMQPNLSLSMSLLGACQKHGNVDLGERAFHWAVSHQPDLASAYVLMWNIYFHAGMWECAKEVSELKERAGAWKAPGQSWIEHEKEVHTFGVRYSLHRQREHELVGRLGLDIARTKGNLHSS